VVSAELHEDGQITLRNVPSYRHAKDVTVTLPDHGPVTGDVAWGGNWFFLTKTESAVELSLRNLEALTSLTWRIRQALIREGVTGNDNGEIDHIELFSAPRNPRAHSRNFVLCPGKSYDRSPCGTGTSAKMACLYADGVLPPGQSWIQESVTGSLFEGHVEVVDGLIVPFITGSAYVTAQSDLVFDERDPFYWGIPA
jgi:4-hydroxyproline epimerase